MSELKIEAIVKFNSGVAYVFNREPDYKYQRDGDLLWAKDGPFYSCYGYEPPSRAFQAFGGREFDLKLLDGGVVHCSGEWWDKGLWKLRAKLGLNLGSLSMKTKEQLIKCYVFYGTSCDLDELEKLKAKYYGLIYDYWEYEAVIKYKPEMRKQWNKRFYEERAKRHLVKKVKELSLKVKQLEKGQS